MGELGEGRGCESGEVAGNPREDAGGIEGGRGNESARESKVFDGGAGSEEGFQKGFDGDVGASVRSVGDGGQRLRDSGR